MTPSEFRAHVAHHPSGVWAQANTEVRIGGRLPSGESVEVGEAWRQEVPRWDVTVSPGCDTRDAWYDDWAMRLAQAKLTAREGMLGYSSSMVEGFRP